MEGRAFDRLTKFIGQSASRRTSVRAALATLLTLGGEEALAKPHAVSKTRRSRLRAEACIPTGKPCPSKKPRGHNKRGNARILSCNRCCQGHTAVVNGITTCACQPDTLPCTTSSECCAGLCTNGSCVANPCDGPALGATCTPGGTPCCTSVNPNAQCAGGINPDTTCQDCTSSPTTAGAFCNTSRGNQCCGGDPNCWVGIKVQDSQPTCLSAALCNGAVGPCSQDSDCPRPTQDPSLTVCIRNDSPSPGGCCAAGVTTICGAPCGSTG